MKIQITGSGIYDGVGEEIPVGTQLDVSTEPKAWAGRYEVISGDSKGKTAITNPAGPKGPFTVKDDGAGWHGVYDGDGEKVKSLRKDDAEAFSDLSADDQIAYLTEA